MTPTAVPVLRIRRPRVFGVLAVAFFLFGSCSSGEGETTEDRRVAPVERSESDGAAAAPDERGSQPADRPPASAPVPAPVPAPAPASAPSPPPRPSPVADAPPPPPREEPPLSPEEAIERACRPPVRDEVESLLACGDVAEAYQQLMENNRSCTRDEDCRVLEGSCSIGLGNCWYAVNASVGYDDADRLAARYRELACSGPVCRCAAPPERAVCDEGVCTADS